MTTERPAEGLCPCGKPAVHNLGMGKGYDLCDECAAEYQALSGP